MERTVTVAAERFEQRDWFLLHGLFLLNGAVFLLAGLATFVLRPESSAAVGFLALDAVLLVLAGAWMLKRVNDVLFLRVCYAFLLLSGLKLSWDGLSWLLR